MRAWVIFYYFLFLYGHFDKFWIVVGPVQQHSVGYELVDGYMFKSL